MYSEISVQELAEEMKGEKPPRLVDVREPHELEISALPNIVHIPLGEIPERMNELDKSGDYVIICRSGGRSGQACAYLAQAGFKVRNMSGGMNRWAAEVDQSLPQY